MSTAKIPTRAEFDAMTPYEKGYASYMYACHQNSEVPDASPFKSDSLEGKEWSMGRFDAYLHCQELEE